MPGIDAVEIRLELRDIGAVIRRVERREQFLHHLAAGVLERAQEATDILVAEREVVGDRGDALQLHVLGSVIADRDGSAALKLSSAAPARDWPCAVSCLRRRRP